MLTEPVPILFIHAFPLDSRMWQPQIDALGNIRVLAPDLRGFGRSRRSPLFDSLDLHAKDLAALLDHSSVPRALVVGLSMGGYIAFALARLFPHRVAGLVLANTRAEADQDVDRTRRDLMIEQVNTVGTSLLPNVMLPGLVTAQCTDATRNTLRAMMLEQNPQGVIAALRALRDRPDARGGLFQIHCPTAVIGGQFDLLTPPSCQQSIVEAIPGSTLTVLPDVGHLSNVESPATFNQTVLETHERAKRYVMSLPKR